MSRMILRRMVAAVAAFTPTTETNTNRSAVTRPVGAYGCWVELGGAGGPGGTGQQLGTGTRGGGGGGGGGCLIDKLWLPLSALGPDYTVAYPAAAAAGSDGGAATFSSGTTSLSAGGGKKGGNGTASAVGAAGAGGTSTITVPSGVITTSRTGGAGGAGGTTAGGIGAAAPTPASNSAGGGGGGGGLNSSGTPSGQGAAGATSSYNSGGAGGTLSNGNGVTPTATNPTKAGGGGGGGGRTSGNTGGFAGGNGSGVGGGGGGQSAGTSATGNPGSGSAGRTVVSWYGVGYTNTTAAGGSGVAGFGSYTATLPAGVGVFVDVATDRGVEFASGGITFNGTPMTLVAKVYSNNIAANGCLHRFWLAGAATGNSDTIASTNPGTAWCVTNVFGIGGTITSMNHFTTYGATGAAGATISHDLSAQTSAAMILQTFAASNGGGSTGTISTISGIRISDVTTAGAVDMTTCIGQAISFASTISAASPWASIATAIA